jgi:class 3 adenylate cyclase
MHLSLTLVLCAIIVLLAIVDLLIIFHFRSRTTRLMIAAQREFENQKKDFLRKTIKPMQDNEEQKFKLAEANLKLLEHQEELKLQKLEMAEANLKLLELKELVECEKERSEKLLLNILPVRVANDLKEKGSSLPECFDNVTVFFSDIVNFTKLTSTIDPREVIQELSTVFTAFDQIFNRNGCVRIKTIGDAYLSVSGMPEADVNHAANILSAAWEAIEYLNERNEESKMKWQMRMGVHSGNVVGGIVGIEKYIYDVFGDTINTAARMESCSEPMKINVSSETYQLTSERFKFHYRGLIDAKGKGSIGMYFLESGRLDKLST